MIEVTDALSVVLQHVARGGTQQRRLTDALGDYLAEPISAAFDSPPFTKSTMDGYAIRVADVPAGEERHGFRVTGRSAAGAALPPPVAGGTAVQIMTGAPLPEGADCVVPRECVEGDLKKDLPDSIRVPARYCVPNACIARRGSAVREGETLVGQGVRVESQHIGLAAEFGLAEVTTFRSATVAVLPTGDELQEPGKEAVAGTIYNSNGPMLASAVQALRAHPVLFSPVSDHKEQLAAAIEDGLQQDFLLLTGGVSRGNYDYVPETLEACGVRPLFHGVRLKPGKPLYCGLFEKDGHRCMVFGMPGNPVSAFVCFHLLAAAAIRKFHGSKTPEPAIQLAELQTDFFVQGDREIWHPAVLETTTGHLSVAPVPWAGSFDLGSLRSANALCCLDAKTTGRFTAGSKVRTLCLDLAIG